MKVGWRAAILFCAGVIVTSGCLFGSDKAGPVVEQLTETPMADTPTPATVETCSGAEQAPEPREASGLQVYGCVTDADGNGIAGVKIYRAYASYEGVVIATTSEDGSYAGEFQPIPGDEMVRVWAEREEIDFRPGSQISWLEGVYYWRHYAGYEAARLDFVAE